jgi:hypothetical protein
LGLWAVYIAPPPHAVNGIPDDTEILRRPTHPRILKAPPGLLLMTDIGVPSFA